MFPEPLEVEKNSVAHPSSDSDAYASQKHGETSDRTMNTKIEVIISASQLSLLILAFLAVFWFSLGYSICSILYNL